MSCIPHTSNASSFSHCSNTFACPYAGKFKKDIRWNFTQSAFHWIINRVATSIYSSLPILSAELMLKRTWCKNEIKIYSLEYIPMWKIVQSFSMRKRHKQFQLCAAYVCLSVIACVVHGSVYVCVMDGGFHFSIILVVSTYSEIWFIQFPIFKVVATSYSPPYYQWFVDWKKKLFVCLFSANIQTSSLTFEFFSRSCLFPNSIGLESFCTNQKWIDFEINSN